jgi:hypothetical protein
MAVKGPTSTPSAQPMQQSQQQQQSDGIQHDKIAMRAYEKWCKRGRQHGTDKQDWMEAERELREELRRTAGSTPQRR